MRSLPLSLLVLLAAAVSAQPSSNQVGSFVADAGPVGVYPVATGLEHPWGMAFLPDGRMLVTERPGRLWIITAEGEKTQVSGTPTVYAQGQGGLMDVALHPDFESNGHVYLTYARPGPEGQAATALGRGMLRESDDGASLDGFEPVFTQEPYYTGGAHFGNRIAFSPDGEYLFLALGERFQFDPAQDLSNHLGTVIRLHADGSVPEDNPFVGQDGAMPEIWSYGHRNIESAAFDANGDLYVAEMGPLGGDELNRIQRGANYGWPEVSWGMDYDGELIPDPTTRPEFTDVVKEWTPTIAPSGMVYYTGSVFPEWQGSFFIGSLVYQSLVRTRVENGEVVDEQILPMGARIREVGQGPDGHLYVLTDKADGAVWVLRPIETRPAPSGG